jgi:SAM-dependent methyltransferase
MALEHGWWLDEVAHAGHEHLDPAYVAGYDTKSPTDWDDTLATLRGAGVGPSSTVVDLGAGTGTFARSIAPYVKRVIAADPSPAMVSAMRARGIEAVQAGFLSYQHEGEPPDAVCTRNALHHLPDYWKAIALGRVAQLLRPGGVLLIEDVVFSFEPRDADTAIEAWLASAPADPSSGWTAAQLAEHVRTEFSTFTWILEAMLVRVGFEIRDRWTSKNQAYAAFTCHKP